MYVSLSLSVVACQAAPTRVDSLSFCFATCVCLPACDSVRVLGSVCLSLSVSLSVSIGAAS